MSFELMQKIDVVKSNNLKRAALLAACAALAACTDPDNDPTTALPPATVPPTTVALAPSTTVAPSQQPTTTLSPNSCSFNHNTNPDYLRLEQNADGSTYVRQSADTFVIAEIRTGDHDVAPDCGFERIVLELDRNESSTAEPTNPGARVQYVDQITDQAGNAVSFEGSTAIIQWEVGSRVVVPEGTTLPWRITDDQFENVNEVVVVHTSGDNTVIGVGVDRMEPIRLDNLTNENQCINECIYLDVGDPN